MRYEPRNDYVLVQPDDAPDRSPGGLVIPLSAQHLCTRGTVVAVGPGFRLPDGSRAPVELEVGDRIEWNPTPAFAMQIVGEYLLMREPDVVARIHDENAVIMPGIATAEADVYLAG